MKKEDLDLLDYFAGLAMNATITEQLRIKQKLGGHFSSREIAEDCYRQAAYMIEVRKLITKQNGK